MSCNIINDKDAKLVYGHGGSQTIISIKKNKKTNETEVFKYFPIILHSDSNNNLNKAYLNEFKTEIDILIELKENIIDNKKTPHIVSIENIKKCKSKPTFFNKCKKMSVNSINKNIIIKDYDNPINKRKSYNDEYDNDNDNINTSYCEFVVHMFDYKISSPMYVIKLEYCPFEFTKLVKKILNYKNEYIENFLNRSIFQIIFSLEIISKLYPYFVHNDLFFRNILCTKYTNYDNKFIRYYYKNMIFDLPANGYILKMNDFGRSQLKPGLGYNSQYSLFKKDNYRDHCNFLFNLYSYHEDDLIRNVKNIEQFNFITNYFNNYFDTDKIKDLSIKTNPWFLRAWNINELNGFVDYIKLKSRKEILKQFKNIFKYDPNHEIIEEYNK